MNGSKPKEPVFSFVVPLHDEAEVLEIFHERLSGVAQSLHEPYEIVYVNDGSQDSTGEILRRLADEDARVRAVELSRNYGHQIAVTAGYDFAAGRAVISLDGDGQHPPELIPDLVARWREGFEVVFTTRKDTAGISRIRRGIGRLVYRVIRRISGADLTDQADFRLLDRKAVDALKAHREHGRFIRALVKHIGFRQVGVTYQAEKRAAGRSSYTLKQLAAMSAAGVFNFSTVPLRFALYLGGILILLAFVYAIGSLVLWPFGMAPSWPVHLVMFVLGMFGLQFIVLGLLGEYVGRTFEQAKARPLYVVRETVGFPAEGGQEPQQETEEQQRPAFTVFT